MEVIIEQEKPRPTFIPAETASTETEAQRAAREKPKLDPEEEKRLEQLRKNALRTMGAEPMSEDEIRAEAEKKAAKKAEEGAAKTEAKAKANEAENKAAEAARAPRPKKPALDSEAIAQAVEKGTLAAVKALEAEKPKTPEPKADDTEKDLSTEDREDLAMIRRIEAADPKRKGLADNFISYTRKLAAYRQRFEAENPGVEFDPNDEKHSGFYKANEPDISAAELEAERESARVDVIVQKRLEEARKPIDEKLAKLEQSEKREAMDKRLRTMAPAAVKAKAENVLALIESVDPQAAKLLTDDKGKFVPSAENIKKLEEYDPWLKEQLDVAARTVARAIEEIHKINDPEMQTLGYTFDPRANDVHRHIANVALDAERTLSAGPADKKVRDGREFVTAQRWHQLTTGADAAKLRDVAARYWTFTPQDLEFLVSGYQAGQIQARAAELERFSASRSKRAPKSEAVPTPKTDDTKPADQRERRRFPNTASATDRVADPAATKSSAQSFGEQAISVAFGA